MLLIYTFAEHAIFPFGRLDFLVLLVPSEMADNGSRKGQKTEENKNI